MGSLTRIASTTKSRPILLPTRQDLGAQQGTATQGGMRGTSERSGMISAPNTEALGSMWSKGAPNRKFWLVGRSRAGLVEVQALSTASALHWHKNEIIFAHSHMPKVCAKIASAFRRPRGRAVERA